MENKLFLGVPKFGNITAQIECALGHLKLLIFHFGQMEN